MSVMPKERIEVWQYSCTRCEHVWQGRQEQDPRVCPKCKSPYWNVPRRSEMKPRAGKKK